jgi:hypothetical protein
LLPCVHRVFSLLKRWLLGTHQSAISQKHLDYYLGELTFRFDRRRSKCRGKLVFRLVQQAVAVDPVPYNRSVHPTSAKAKRQSVGVTRVKWIPTMPPLNRTRERGASATQIILAIEIEAHEIVALASIQFQPLNLKVSSAVFSRSRTVSVGVPASAEIRSKSSHKVVEALQLLDNRTPARLVKN